MPAARAVGDTDWLRISRRAARGVRRALKPYATTAERAVPAGRGEGGDMALVIDRAAEDAIFSELESTELPLTAISEERGEVPLRGGGPVHVVIDPVDGSLNAKRGLPFASVSIAIASGRRMSEVEFAYVGELATEREWWARRGGGAEGPGGKLRRLEPGPLELLGLETARPELVAAAAKALAGLEAERVRSLGSVAVSICLVAEGALDAMLSLRTVRSVDVAGAQLILREAGGAVAFPEAGVDPPLDLDMRSQVLAARDSVLLERIARSFGSASGPD